MTLTELQKLEMRLDVLNGSVVAQMDALKTLIAMNGSDPRLAAILSGAIERSRTGLLGSSASDAYIEGFDHMAAELLAQAEAARGS